MLGNCCCSGTCWEPEAFELKREQNVLRVAGRQQQPEIQLGVGRRLWHSAIGGQRESILRLLKKGGESPKKQLAVSRSEQRDVLRASGADKRASAAGLITAKSKTWQSGGRTGEVVSPLYSQTERTFLSRTQIAPWEALSLPNCS